MIATCWCTRWNRATRARRWRPYVNGPDGAPLVAPTKVNDLIRKTLRVAEEQRRSTAARATSPWRPQIRLP